LNKKPKIINDKILELSCEFNIKRLNRGPDNWRAVISSTIKYDDYDFPASQSSLYWDGHIREGS
jgi:hypothetical protein